MSTLREQVQGLLAERADLMEQVLGLNKRIGDVQAEGDRRVSDELKKFDALDREAVAIARCVAAIERMRDDRNSSMSFASSYVSGGWAFDPDTGQRIEQPKSRIGSTGVGRIILHLAERYGVDLDGAS